MKIMSSRNAFKTWNKNSTPQLVMVMLTLIVYLNTSANRQRVSKSHKYKQGCINMHTFEVSFNTLLTSIAQTKIFINWRVLQKSVNSKLLLHHHFHKHEKTIGNWIFWPLWTTLLYVTKQNGDHKVRVGNLRVNNNTRASRRGGWVRERARPCPNPFGEGRATGQLLMGSRVITVSMWRGSPSGRARPRTYP